MLFEREQLLLILQFELLLIFNGVSSVNRDFNDHIIFLIEENGGSDSGLEPQEDDFAETRFSRTDRDCAPSKKSEEVLCSMYTQAENWTPVNENPVCRTLHHYLPEDADVFKKHTAGNKYGDFVTVQRKSSQTLDFPLSNKFPQHLNAPGLFKSERLSAVLPSPSSKHVGQFSSFPKTINHVGGMFTPQSVILPLPFMCQLPKHNLASQVSFSSNVLHLIHVCSFQNCKVRLNINI